MLRSCAAVLSAFALVSTGAMQPASSEQHPVTAHVHTLDTLPIPSFSPTDVVIRVGDSVRWDNHAPRVHTVTHERCPRLDMRNDPADCVFDTLRDRGEDLGTGDEFTVTFDVAGIYPYQCAIHRFGGTITVLDGSGALPNLIVDQISFHQTPLGTSVRVKALVSNIGEAAAPGSRVHFDYRPVGATEWTRFGDAEISALLAGGQVEVNQDWTTFNKVGDFEVRVGADGAESLVESDETDNSAEAAYAILLPEGTLPGVGLPDPPSPQPVTTRIPSPLPTP
ncbi:MAG: CARDB domain-containing protein [Actinomycetota bacterium]